MGKVLGYTIRELGAHAKANLSLIDERWIFSTERKCILKHLKFRDKINLNFEYFL